MTEELKLVEQCYDPLEYGYLHGFNRKLTIKKKTHHDKK